MMIERRLSAWFSTFLLLSSIHCNLVQGVKFKRATSLTEILGPRKLPGIAAFAVRSNGTLEDGVAGVRKEGSNTTMTTEDKFHLGSNTKAMTATLLAIMVENGNGSLTWETTLPEALPDIGNMSASFQNTTLAMVAAHRSGIADDISDRNITLLTQLFDPEFDPVVGRRIVTQQFLEARPDMLPNRSFSYSNVNYMILGHIIDQQGTPWEEAIKTELWDPLEMDNCGFGPPPQSSPESIDNPWPHLPSSSGPVPLSPYSTSPAADNPLTYNSAGRVHCSMGSYSKFLALHLSALEGRNTSLLPSSSFDILHTGFPMREGEEPQNVFTSGGWAINSLERYGGSYLIHAGSNTLNYVVTILAPGRNVSVAALTNVGGTQAEEGCLDAINSWFSGELNLKSVEGGNGSAPPVEAAESTLYIKIEVVVLVAAGIAAFVIW